MNYADLRADDRQLLLWLRDFLAESGLPAGARGVDMGAGANLYPALAMLPFCTDVTLVENSANNVEWLTSATSGYGAEWDPYWSLLAEHPTYARLDDPRSALAAAAHVSQGDVFRAGEARWDVGTMFFLAESMTTYHDEFARAVTAFVTALRPGSPFFAAFMENSTGYSVAGRDFPAVRITAADVEHALEDVAVDVTIRRVGTTDKQLRKGYTGMLAASGRVRAGAPTRPRGVQP